MLSKLEIVDVEKEEEYNFLEIHKKSVIDLEVVPERPPLAISIGLDDKEYGIEKIRYPLKFGTYGNISMIKGEEKARKSFLKSLIISCAIGGNANNYSEEIQGHGLSDKYIIDIDTEQGEYDCWLNGSRIPKMVGTIPDNYLYVSLREQSKKEIRGYLEWLYMESEFRNKLGLTCIDGYADCVDNFNDNIECDDFARKLMKYSTVTKSHITGILHLNPGSEKGRGHLGTILQQKCETVVIIKDGGEHSEVTCQRVRGSKKFKPFTIRVDNDWMPYVSDDEIGIPQQQILLR